jgi:hypothetical protein
MALVAWQVLAVGRLLRTRGSLKPLSGREGALKPHFYVRFKIRDIKVNKKWPCGWFQVRFWAISIYPSRPESIQTPKSISGCSLKKSIFL